MANHVLKRGLDIPIAGGANGAPVELAAPASVAYAPQEFRGIVPKPAVKAGEVVRAGAVLFFHKRNPKLVFRSPIAGTVREIRRGDKRVITDIIVDAGGDEAETFKVWTAAEVQGASRDQMVEALLASGLWAHLRTRPFDYVADPEVTPQSILVSATQTGPLQPGVDVLLRESDAAALQLGVDILKKLSAGAVHFASESGKTHPAFAKLQGVEAHTFAGPHPAGDPAVQVSYIDPPRGSNQVWWIRAWELALVGRFFLEGRFPAERVYAAVGAGLKAPRFVRTVLGAPLADVAGETPQGVRWIRGSVLTGMTSTPDRWASFYEAGVHVLPDTVEREIMGWTMPQLGKFSFHRSFLSGFSFGRGKSYDMRPGLFGGVRTMVPFGHYSEVVATPDISPHFLFRSIIAGDLEDAVELGLLDISEEEAALMTYVCPAKLEYDVLLRGALERYVKET